MNFSLPLVSIIIPCYNAEKYIEDSIKSALSQTYLNCEIIVIDDGSNDGSLSIIKQFKDRIKIVTGPNQGSSSARNRGLQIATGQWIQFLDGDDLISSTKIEEQIKIAIQFNHETLFTCSWGRFTSELSSANIIQDPVCHSEDPKLWLIEKYLTAKMTPIHSWLVSKKLIAKSGGWDETITRNDDGEFFDRIVLNSRRVIHCARGVAYYRSGDSGTLSQCITAEAFDSILRSYKNNIPKFLEIDSNDTVKEACSSALMRLAYYCYPTHAEIARKAEACALSIYPKRPPLPGGQIIRVISDVFSWRLARIIQYKSRKIRKVKDPVTV